MKSLVAFLGLVSIAITAHSDLLHFGEKLNDLICLVCYMFMALNNPVISQYTMRKENE